MTEETERTKKGFGTKIGKFLSGKWHYLIVLVFGLILSVGIWGFLDRTMVGDDYAFHINRLQSASKGWANGQILPQVDPDALNGFGYAYNLFYGPLLSYLAAGLQALIVNWAIVINIVLVICMLVSGIWMCYAVQRISQNRVLAALVGIIYMAAPYHLTDLYSRMALGEVAALAVAPVLILGLYQLTAHEKHAARSLAIGAALLILTHSLSALLFALMAAVYVILNIRTIFNVESIWRMVLAVVVALLLTAFFWLPLVEARMTGIYGVFDDGYAETYFGANGQSLNDHRVGPEKLLVTDSYGGACDLAVGIIALVGVIGFLLVRSRIEDKTEQRFVTSLYIIALLAVAGMSSLINWHMMPMLLKQIQFPWRLMGVFTLAMSVVSGYTIFALMKGLAEDKQRILVVIVGVVALYPVIGVFMPKEERHLAVGDSSWTEIGSASLGWQAEYAPKQLLCSPDDPEEVKQGFACSLGKIGKVIDERGVKIVRLKGQARVMQAEKEGLKMKFAVQGGASDTVLELPLIYYPGYAAKLDDEVLEVGHSERLGLVTVAIPEGMKGEVEVYYGLSRATKIGMMVSAVTAGLGLIWVIISGIRDRRVRKKHQEMNRLMDSVRQVMEENQAKQEMEDDAMRIGGETEKVNEKQLQKTEVARENVKPKKTAKTSAKRSKEVTKPDDKSATKTEKKTKITARSAVETDEPKVTNVKTKTTRIKAGKKEDKV